MARVPNGLIFNYLRLGENLERETGFEPATSTLARSHSTTELLPLNLLIIDDGLNRQQCAAVGGSKKDQPTTKDTKFHEGLNSGRSPSCTFVSFVVKSSATGLGLPTVSWNTRSDAVRPAHKVSCVWNEG